jgi:hypothetical protein
MVNCGFIYGWGSSCPYIGSILIWCASVIHETACFSINFFWTYCSRLSRIQAYFCQYNAGKVHHPTQVHMECKYFLQLICTWICMNFWQIVTVLNHLKIVGDLKINHAGMSVWMIATDLKAYFCCVWYYYSMVHSVSSVYRLGQYSSTSMYLY